MTAPRHGRTCGSSPPSRRSRTRPANEYMEGHDTFVDPPRTGRGRAHRAGNTDHAGRSGRRWPPTRGTQALDPDAAEASSWPRSRLYLSPGHAPNVKTTGSCGLAPSMATRSSAHPSAKVADRAALADYPRSDTAKPPARRPSPGPQAPLTRGRGRDAASVPATAVFDDDHDAGALDAASRPATEGRCALAQPATRMVVRGR